MNGPMLGRGSVANPPSPADVKLSQEESGRPCAPHVNASHTALLGASLVSHFFAEPQPVVSTLLEDEQR